MADFLQRAQSPLSSEDWARLEKTVADTARQHQVTRRFIDPFGPIGAGHQVVPRLSLTGSTVASADATGLGGTPITVGARTLLPLTIVYQDFTLHWRDVELARQSGLPLDFAAAAAAASLCAAREDDLVLHGDKTMGIEGLTTAHGHRSTTRRDWGIAGHAYLDVVEATDRMTAAGFYSPFALVCSPNLFACLLRVSGSSGAIELSQVRELCTAGVFSSPQAKSAALVAVGPHNVDLVIGQDMTVGFLRSENMDYVFRVLETIALRIKRPGAVCAMAPRSASPTHRVRRGVPEEALGGGD